MPSPILISDQIKTLQMWELSYQAGKHQEGGMKTNSLKNGVVSGLAEKLFQQLEKTNERFEVKIMVLDVVSRLIGLHQLFLLNYYPYIQRFMQPHQRGERSKFITNV
jgi:hypothetical protein